MSARKNGKCYKTEVKQAFLYGLEAVELTRRQEAKLEEAESKMLRFSLRVSRTDRIKTEHIRVNVQVGRIEGKVKEARLRRQRHVKASYAEYIGRRMLIMK